MRSDAPGDDLVSKTLVGALLRLAIPALTGNLFIIVFEIVDMAWVGRLGADSVAALGAASFFIWMLRALAQWVATGALAVVSRRIGAGNRLEAAEKAVHAQTGALLVAFAVTVVSLLFLPSLWRIIGLDPPVRLLAITYSRIFLFGLPFLYLMVSAEHVLRGLGDTITPMRIIALSLIINAVLDPVLIYVAGMGLKGAAWATVAAHAVGCAGMLRGMRRKLPDCRMDCMTFRRPFWKVHLLPMMRIGAPISLNGLFFAMIYLMLTGIISRFGSDALAAVSIGHRIESVPFFIALSLSMAASTMVGQHLGAGMPDRAERGVRLTLGVGVSILMAISVVFWFLPERLYGLFIADPSVIAAGSDYLRIVALFEGFLAVEIILEGAFSGAGDTKPPMWVAVPLTLLRVPASALFAVHWGMGVRAVWYAVSGTTALKGVVLYIIWRKGRWKEKQV